MIEVEDLTVGVGCRGVGGGTVDGGAARGAVGKGLSALDADPVFHGSIIIYKV